MKALVSPTLPLQTPRIVRCSILSKLAYKQPNELTDLWSKYHPNEPITPYIDYNEETVIHELMYMCDKTPMFVESSICKEDTQAYIVQCKDDMYITFRGTSSIKDALTNIELTRVPLPNYPNAQVHKGFLEQYKAIENSLFDAISNAQRNPDGAIKQIHITGHSLGGALAQLAAFHISNRFIDAQITCTTFGSPRVGNHTFAKLLQNAVHDQIRVTHEKDPVPNMPFFLWWVHATNQCIQVYRESQDNVVIRYVYHDVPWYKRMIAFVATLWPLHLIPSIAMHHIDTYVRDWLILQRQSTPGTSEETRRRDSGSSANLADSSENIDSSESHSL